MFSWACSFTRIGFPDYPSILKIAGRGATAIAISPQLVTGLVTVNGNFAEELPW